MSWTWDGGPRHTIRYANPLRSKEYIGITLLRDGDGNWTEHMNPVESVVLSASYALRGGYIATVEEPYYSELVAAGYGDHLS